MRVAAASSYVELSSDPLPLVRILAEGVTDPDPNVLPVWFNHSASHDPKVWHDHDVPGMI